MSLRIAHLVDDLSAGGVTRSLDYLSNAAALGSAIEATTVSVNRGALGAPRVEADVVVSHLSISWRNLPMLIALRARYAHLPLIHVEHSYSEGFVAHEVKAPRRFAKLLRLAYALFDRVVAVSDAQGAWMTREGLVRPEALHVIQTSIDLAPFLAVAPARGRDAKVIGAIGRFHRQKGFATLIAAFRAAAGPDQTLRLIGDGPERDALVAAAGDDPRIEFRPFTNDPAAEYASCDVVALPSLWEPYGLVALEARAAGRPVLVAQVDGLKDQIEENCIGVASGAWASTIAALPGEVHTARIAAARRAAKAQNVHFVEGWLNLLADVTAQQEARAAA